MMPRRISACRRAAVEGVQDRLAWIAAKSSLAPATGVIGATRRATRNGALEGAAQVLDAGGLEARRSPACSIPAIDSDMLRSAHMWATKRPVAGDAVVGIMPPSPTSAASRR
jgi:hypothetical protein